MSFDAIKQLLDVVGTHVDHMRKAWHSAHIHEFSRNTKCAVLGGDYDDYFIRDIAQGEFWKMQPMEKKFEKMRVALLEHGIDLKIHCPYSFMEVKDRTIKNEIKNVLLIKPLPRTSAGNFYTEATVLAENGKRKSFAIGSVSRIRDDGHILHRVPNFSALKEQALDFLHENGGPMREVLYEGADLRRKYVYDIAADISKPPKLLEVPPPRILNPQLAPRNSSTIQSAVVKSEPVIIEPQLAQKKLMPVEKTQKPSFVSRLKKKLHIENPSEVNEEVKSVEREIVKKGGKWAFSMIAGIVGIALVGTTLSELFDHKSQDQGASIG
jgi:hypothetical protein